MFFKALMFSLFAGTLLAGCNFDVSSSGSSTSDGAVDAQVEGRAVKGVLQNAQIVAYVLENGTRREVGRALTDEEGNFDLALTGIKDPVLLQVTADPHGNSTMVCDAVGGCGAVAFGEVLPMPEEFSLTTIMLPGELENTVAITPLTHLAGTWLLDMPGEVDESRLALARGRVASLFDVAPEFAFQRVPDVSRRSEIETSDDRSLGHAVMASSFAEMAYREIRYSPDNIKLPGKFAASFAANGGQLEQSGHDVSLDNLLSAASRTLNRLDGHDALPEMAARVSHARSRLTRGLSRANGVNAANGREINDARTLFDELGTLLDTAGINEEGDFFARIGERLAPLASPDNAGVGSVLRETMKYSALVSVLGDYYAGLNDSEVLTLAGSDSHSITYEGASRTLRITGLWHGQDVDISVQVPALVDTLEAGMNADFHASLALRNDSNSLNIGTSLQVDALDTDISPLADAIDAVMLDATQENREALTGELLDLTKTLHANVRIAADIDLVSFIAGTEGFDASFTSRLTLDMPARIAGNDYISLALESLVFDGFLDTVISGMSDSALAHLTVGKELTMDIGMKAALLGMPMVSLRGTGAIEDFGSRLSALLDNPLEALQAPTSSIASLYPGLSGVHFDGSLAVQAIDRHHQLRLADRALTLSMANSTREGVTIQFAPSGATLFGGGKALGTMSPNGRGLELFLADASSREYNVVPKSTTAVR